MEVFAGAFRRERPTLLRISAVLPILTLLLIFPSPCNALDCHVCNSKIDEKCVSDFSGFVETCAPDETTCRKYEMTFEPYKMDQMKRIVRECAVTSTNECYTDYGVNGRKFSMTVCDCNGDKCNNAANVKLNSILIGSVMLFLVARLLGKLY